MIFTAAVLAAGAAAAPAATVAVERNGDRWTAEYRFSERAPAWILTKSPVGRVSGKSWRPESWTILTPGVRLERHGFYDVLVADKRSVPACVRLRFKPSTADVESSYDPALAFTDGSVALYSNQFKVLPAATVAAVDKLPIDLEDSGEGGRPTAISFHDRSGPVLFRGKRVATARFADDSSTYVLFGRARPLDSPALVTIIDPALPGHMQAFIAATMPAILARYDRLIGPRSGGKPTLMASWAGPTPHQISMGGSVLEGQVVMAFEGEGVLKPNPKLTNYARWFVAHESAHFWLGQEVSYARSGEAWITEGGADLLAYRTVAALDPAYDVRAALQQALDDCLASSRKGPVETANERNDPKAYYNCGTVIGLVTEQAAGGDFPRFVRQLIAANRADEAVSKQDWLGALEALAPGRSLSGRVEQLLTTAQPQPQRWIELLQAGGIGFRLRPDGSPELL